MTFLIGPLTGIAMADAVEGGHEFIVPFEKPSLFFYKQATMWPYAVAGSYSDDTQQTLAVAEALFLHAGSRQKNNEAPRAFADKVEKKLLEVFVRDRIPSEYNEEGYRGGGLRMQAALKTAAAAKEKHFVHLLETKGNSSGAAMRSSVIGLCMSSAEKVRTFTRAQAEMTHSGDGVLAAEAAALMVYFTKAGHPKAQLRALLADTLGDERFRVLPEKMKMPGNAGMACVLAALWVLERTDTLCDMLQMIADLGGDTDTVGVIAMGAAWMSKEFTHDLPIRLWERLENGPYGRDYLRKVEKRLMDRTGYGELRAA